MLTLYYFTGLDFCHSPVDSLLLIRAFPASSDVWLEVTIMSQMHWIIINLLAPHRPRVPPFIKSFTSTKLNNL